MLGNEQNPDAENIIELKDILDVKVVQKLLDDFYSITKFGGTGITDLKGRILVSSGWQSICKNFHIANPLSRSNCLTKDAHLIHRIKCCEYFERKCHNNLCEILIPIYVSEHCVGSLFIGQFLYDDEIPPYETFANQAEEYGFEKEAYMNALYAVPRWSREKVNSVISLYTEFAAIMSRLLTSNLHLAKALKENKKVISELIKIEDRYKLISENTGDVIWILELETLKFSYVSPSVKKLRGFSSEEVLNQPLNEALTPESLRFILEKLPARIAEVNMGNEQQRILTEEIYQPRKDGSVVPTEVVTTLISDANGKIIEVLGVTRDISQRKRDELIKESLIDELNKSNRDLEQFAYVASHDLKEPLRMITNYMQLLSRNYKYKLDERADTYINFAVEGAMRMNALINDLLIYSRVSAKLKEYEPVDLNLILEEVLTDLQLTIQENNAAVNHTPLPAVMADSLQIKLLFQNLIQNAIKFKNGESPKVDVASERNGKEWIFSVSDNGIGIDPQFNEKIFEIFQRLNERGKYEGTGIGLAICKKIVEHHGGRIWVESQPGYGSTFHFTLPAEI